jgi:hypothetical protein
MLTEREAVITSRNFNESVKKGTKGIINRIFIEPTLVYEVCFDGIILYCTREDLQRAKSQKLQCKACRPQKTAC